MCIPLIKIFKLCSSFIILDVSLFSAYFKYASMFTTIKIKIISFYMQKISNCYLIIISLKLGITKWAK